MEILEQSQLEIRQKMAKLNDYELVTLKNFQNVCIKALGIKYDVRDPFNVLLNFSNGRTNERYT